MDRQLAKTLGNGLRRARRALELTQEEAAERIDVSVEFYARIERGHALPSMATFVRMVHALAVSADELIQSDADRAGWRADAPETENPELELLLPSLRRASPDALRLVALLMKEMDQTALRKRRGSPRESR